MFVDKRILLRTIELRLDVGTILPVNVYVKKNGNRMIARFSYGELEIYTPRFCSKKLIEEFAYKVVRTHSDHIFARPFYKENVYIYMLGKKKYFTNDITKKDDENYFYIPSNTKDPLTRYKKLFLDYLSVRAVELGKKMNVDLSSWKFRTGLFLSYAGCCFPTKHQMKFDYRLFAYKPYISDCIIYHEIAHVFEIKHNEKFYSIVKYYCPDYDHLEKEVNLGHFEGDMDYVIPRH